MSDPDAAEQPLVALAGVSQIYHGPPRVAALRPTDLIVDRGDYLAVMGPSGSGKSTLLDIMALLRPPTSGVHRIDGDDVTDLSERARSRLRSQRLGVVFQSYHLLAYRSALDNVALAQMYAGIGVAARRGAAAHALDRVGLSHRAHALPTTLSGGEQQRVAVARAIVNRPSLLLCDEPTGNLDSANTRVLLDLLGELQDDGITIVLITHAQEVAARARRHAHMRDGRLTEKADR